jgi:hypothetical protein
MRYSGMDSILIFFKTGLTGLFGLFYLHHFPEESDENINKSCKSCLNVKIKIESIPNKR